MPAELFRTVAVAHHAPGHRAGAAPITFLVHALIVVAVVTIPLVADVTLPAPNIPLTLTLDALPAVVVPALPRAPAARRISLQADVARVPLEAPTGIGPEIAHAPFVPNAQADVPTAGIGSLEGTDLGVVSAPEAPPKAAPPKIVAPVRVGVVSPPHKVLNVAPTYPTAALLAHVQGTVVIEAVIAIDGRVQEAHVIKSVALLDQAALDAVRQWMFTPTLLRGVPVPVIMTVNVEFKLGTS